MAESKNTFSDNNYKKQFVEKYDKLLLEISECPEDFQVRKAYIDEKVGWDNFATDIYIAAYPKAFRKLSRARIKETLPEKQDKDIPDSIAFAESLKKAIEKFHQTEEKDGILHYLHKVCKLKNNTAKMEKNFDSEFAGAGDFDHLSDDGKVRKKIALLRLEKKIGELNEKIRTGKISYEEVEKELDAHRKEIRASKNDLQNAHSLVQFFSAMPSLDKDMDDGEGGSGVLLDIAQIDARADLFEQHSEMDPWESFTRENTDAVAELIKNSAETWNLLKAAGSKLKLATVQAFLTHSVLWSMKCTPEYLDHKKKATKFYTKIPAGNKEVYDRLEPCEKELYSTVFQKEYLAYVFEQYPTVLENIYAWFLKEGIQLVDQEIADAFGVNKSTISKARTTYKKNYIPALKRAMSWRDVD